jgi:hypothetical protein
MYLKWQANTSITRSTISHNRSGAGGGGLYTYGGYTVIMDSTISNNNAAGNGGGFYVYDGELVVGNSTISKNSAEGNGGGVFKYQFAGPVKFYNATIFENRAKASFIGNGDGGGLYIIGGNVFMKNSILAGNMRSPLNPSSDDCKGTLVSQDYNLIEETEGCTISGTATHDQIGVDLKLDSLADNGGPTLTRMPQQGSEVIDKGNPDGCTDTDGLLLATDQRGYPRTVDGDGVGGAVCDVGAVEFAPNPVPSLTSLNPATTQAGGNDFILTVNGSNFMDGSVVQWNGSARTTTYISATQLSAQIKSADIASQGSASITVFNPEPGGGVSNSLTFTITPQPPPTFFIYLPLVLR